LEYNGLNEVVTGYDCQTDKYRQPETRDIQKLGFKTGTSVFFLPAPFVDTHHLEWDENEEIKEGTVVTLLQRELYAEQGGHDNAGKETGVVLRVTDSEYIGDSDDGCGYSDAPGSVRPFKQCSGGKDELLCYPEQSENHCEHCD